MPQELRKWSLNVFLWDSYVSERQRLEAQGNMSSGLLNYLCLTFVGFMQIGSLND